MTKLNTPLRAEPGETQDFAILVDAKGDVIARDLSPEHAALIVGRVNVDVRCSWCGRQLKAVEITEDNDKCIVVEPCRPCVVGVEAPAPASPARE